MLEMGIPVGAGTDATRVSSYNPFVALHWLVTGKTVGGLELYPAKNLMDRTEAVRLYTQGSAWFSNEQGVKGALTAGRFADLAILSADYFSIPEDEIPGLVSVLTMVNGKVVYADEEFRNHGPRELPVSPDWSPVAAYGGYFCGGNYGEARASGAIQSAQEPHVHRSHVHSHGGSFGLGCDCFAF